MGDVTCGARVLFSFPLTLIRPHGFVHSPMCFCVRGNVFPRIQIWQRGVKVRCFGNKSDTTGIQWRHVARRIKWSGKHDEGRRDHRHRLRPISTVLINWLQMVCLLCPISGALERFSNKLQTHECICRRNNSLRVSWAGVRPSQQIVHPSLDWNAGAGVPWPTRGSARGEAPDKDSINAAVEHL